MNLFDIIGPVMVGPSSSHTAGAVKIGYVSRKLLQEPVASVEVLLYGSFLLTGDGHGTGLAIVAGLLGMLPDDARIPHSLEIAEAQNMKVTFGKAELKEGHPNSVLLKLVGTKGRNLEVVGQSLGGSVINIASIDGLSANFSGDYPTLIVHNEDQPGHIADVTGMLSECSINIATLQLYRESRGGNAVMVLECDQEVPESVLDKIEKSNGIQKVTYYSLREKES